MSKRNDADVAAGCFLFAWFLYALAFVAFWGFIVWAIWRVVVSFT